VCFEQCPCHAIEMEPEPGGVAPAHTGDAMPMKFTVRP